MSSDHSWISSDLAVLKTRHSFTIVVRFWNVSECAVWNGCTVSVLFSGFKKLQCFLQFFTMLRRTTLFHNSDFHTQMSVQVHSPLNTARKRIMNTRTKQFLGILSLQRGFKTFFFRLCVSLLRQCRNVAMVVVFLTLVTKEGQPTSYY